ncbi:hypothetical protein KAU11_07385, partial [Candidatus Babeliales bacterium]|nr:hypothetical protein [Candidatus Babeliales bacterium]
SLIYIMASLFYNNYYTELAEGGIDYTTDTIKMALMTTSYTQNIDTHSFFSDLTGEASGTGYTTGGQAVGSITVTQDDTNDRAVIDFADEVFSTVTVTDVDSYVLYKDTGVAATSPLIARIEFTEGAQSTVGGDFTVIPSATGVHTIG